MECILGAYQRVVVEYGYLINPNRGCELNIPAMQKIIGILGSRDAELTRLMHRVKVINASPIHAIVILS